MPNPILLIEHEVKLSRLIELELTDKGYQVSMAYDSGTGLKLPKRWFLG